MKTPVRKMFDEISSRYDFLNHFLSLGRDKVWRKTCVKKLKQNIATKSDLKLLDLCGGTGDFAFAFEKEIPCQSLIADFSYGMLAEAPKKNKNAKVVQCDAMKMPFANDTFDVILNGFGMRNLPDAAAGLQESFRVLKKDGYLCILEFFSPRGIFNRFFYKILAPLFIPFIGAFFSGKKEAYDYLVKSILRFLPVDEFVKKAELAGFELVSLKSFDFGISFGVILRKIS